MSLSVAVLAGGLSLEREVSLRSGRRVADALADRGHRVTRLDLDHQLVERIADENFDVAYLTLHGKAGEDGTIQGLLELLDLPYTGPDALASALAWDKAVFKGLARRAGLSTPDWVAVPSESIRDLGAGAAIETILARLGAPVVVKPAQGGGAMGVRFVEAQEHLAAALVAAYSYSPVVLVERFVAGTEVAVSIVDGAPLPPVEVVPRGGAAYDFSARYTPGATDFYAPARLPEPVLERCRALALQAYLVAGCRHVTRADLIVDEGGRPWLLELDTCPGMTETSLLPVAAGAQGWSFQELCQRVVTLGAAQSAPT